MWASMKPAVSAAPLTSTVSRASRGPQPAIVPSAIARSVAHPLPRARHEDAAAGQQQVGRLVARARRALEGFRSRRHYAY